VFDLIASKGVEEEEMRHVFNLGIGYVFIVDPTDEAEVMKVLADMGEKPRRVGAIVRA
jgi:phosphoribosylformylglycinamidine cyclo-ligase